MANESTTVSDAPETEDDKSVHRRICERADELWSWWQDNIQENETDREMVAGNQWSPAALEERKGKITMTVNKLSQYIDRVMGDILQNPTNIKYRATTYQSGTRVQGKKAKKEYETAEVRTSIAKDIEIQSNAESWYNLAAQNMCEGGFGWLRVDAILNDFNKMVMEISGVQNPSDAMIDYNGIQADFSDARDGFVFTRMPRAKFKKLYPDSAASDFSANHFTSRYPWCTEDLVVLAEYWERIRRPQEELIKAANEGKTLNPYKVVWRRVSGAEILEGGAAGNRTPFTSIPLVPMIGSCIIRADGKKTFQSAHRHARDAQKDANYWRSEMTMQVAAQANQPWVGTATMFEDNENDWETANINKPSRLIYKVDPESPTAKPTKEAPPQIPAAAMELYLNATQDLGQAIGMYSASVGTIKGDESGRAILAKERQDSTGKFGFTKGRDNAVRRVGKLLQEGMKYIYAEEQEIRIYGEDQSVDYADIPGAPIFEGECECYVEAGPAYATQRIETVNILMDLAKNMPEQLAATLDIILENLDFPAAQRAAERVRRGMNPAMLSVNERQDLQKEERESGVEPPPLSPDAVLAAQIEQAKQAQKEAQLAIEQVKAKQQELEAMTVQAQAANNEQVETLVAQAIAKYISETQQAIKR